MTRTLACNRCGAPLSADDEDKRVTCSYCGVVNELSTEAAITSAPGGVTGNRVSTSSAVVGVGCLVLIGGITASVLALRSKPSEPDVPSINISIPAIPKMGGATGKSGTPDGTPTGPKGFMWIDQYTAPVGVDANGDGVEDMAGSFVFDEDGRLVVWAGVIDGKSFDMMWKAGPFGIREKASRKTGVAVAGDRALVVDVTGKARLYGLADGKEIASFPFKSSDVRGLCGPPEGQTSFYLRKDWADGQLVDGKTASAKNAPPPAWCKYSEGERRMSDTGDTTNGNRAVPVYTNQLPDQDGMEWQGAQQTNDDAVGTMTPKGDIGLVVAGFDPKTKTIRWKTKATDLVSGFEEKGGPNEGHQLAILDIGDGRAIVSVHRGWIGAPTVMALDTKTGKKLWSAEAPGAAPFTHTLTKKRLYLVCGEWPALPIDILDVETGKLLARLGG